MTDPVFLGSAMLLTGCVAGVLAGVFGIGGGIVIVPVLDAALGIAGVDPAIRMHVAVATSLSTIVPTSIASARAHHARQSVDFDVVRRWTVYVLIGAALGAALASRLHSRTLALVFASLALLVALKMLLLPASRNLTTDLPKSPLVAVVPFGIGGASSMMGIGGGTLSVATLTLFNQPIHRAVGTAALFGLAISLPGTAGFMLAGYGDPRLPPYSIGFVNLVGIAFIAPATWLTAPLGAALAHRLTHRQLSVSFGIFLLVVSLRMLGRAI
jgi:uncharacterized membrane protein YfcA